MVPLQFICTVVYNDSTCDHCPQCVAIMTQQCQRDRHCSWDQQADTGFLINCMVSACNLIKQTSTLDSLVGFGLLALEVD